MWGPLRPSRGRPSVPPGRRPQVYFAATGGAGALLSRCIRSYTVLAYAELGPEALAAMEVVDFPVIVVGDVEGGDYYMEGPKAYAKR